MWVATGAVIILDNNVGCYWSRYFNSKTMLVAAGAVIILNNIVCRDWSRYYTEQHS